MDWLTVTVLTTTAGAEILSQLLIDSGSAGTMIEDKSDVAASQRPEGQWDMIDPAVIERMGDDVKVTGYYVADTRVADTLQHIRAAVAGINAHFPDVDFGKREVVVGSVDDEDWAENWKKGYHPMRLGTHIVVRPSWTEYAPQPDDHVIVMDPGMAFGTGSHETTGMCAALVEQYVRPGDHVIDVGTGTGILAMVAAFSGASDVLATDLDPMAVRVAAENVRANDLTDVIRTREGNLLDAVDEVADVVVANIIADVIIGLAEPVRAHIADGGYFICSGIARALQDRVIDALNAAGYRSLDVRNDGEWTAIACQK